MNIGEYTITEAGFGSDLGAEKFMDIVCHNGKIKPNAVVLVASIRSLKMHGGADKNNLSSEDVQSLVVGLDNLKQHIYNIKSFGIPIVVAINQFQTDTKQELSTLADFFVKQKVAYSFTTLFADGSKGATDLAKKVIKLAKSHSKLIPVYSMTDNLQTKIEKIVKRCYGASGVVYAPKALDKLERFNDKVA
jgi:formate--tetrahydrofolate ligase